MNRKTQIKCTYCDAEQVVHLLATPDKPAGLIDRQVVRCVKCGRDFPVLNTEKIVDGPYEV